MAVKAIMRKDLERALTVAKIPTWEEKAVVLEALLAIMLQQEAVTARSLSGIGRMRNN
mgnify:CR=1 FL=1